MRTIIYYELKKIFEKRLNIIAMAAGVLLYAVCLYAFVNDIDIYDPATNSYLKGKEAVSYRQAKINSMTDYITEEYVTNTIAKMQSKNIDFSSDDAYMEIIRHYDDMYNFLATNYVDYNQYTYEEAPFNNKDLGINALFYERRVDKIKGFLNTDYSFGNFSDREKEYWLEKAKSVTTPFKWGDVTSMETTWELITISFYLVFVVCICIAPIFSSEYESGAVALLLTTKHGKTKQITAKIITALLFSLLYFVGIITISIIIGWSIYGVNGVDLPIQLFFSAIPYNLTAGQICIISFLAAIILGLAYTSITLFLSSRIKSSIAILVIDFTILVLPASFPMSKEWGWWNHINYLFSIRCMNLKEVVRIINSYQIGSVIFSYLEMIFIVYIILAIVPLFFVKRGFASHQVDK